LTLTRNVSPGPKSGIPAWESASLLFFELLDDIHGNNLPRACLASQSFRRTPFFLIDPL
jgi:hypothetical protein